MQMEKANLLRYLVVQTSQPAEANAIRKVRISRSAEPGSFHVDFELPDLLIFSEPHYVKLTGYHSHTAKDTVFLVLTDFTKPQFLDGEKKQSLGTTSPEVANEAVPLAGTGTCLTQTNRITLQTPSGASKGRVTLPKVILVLQLIPASLVHGTAC